MHRRLICCVLAIEIAEHDQRPLFDQIRVTEDLRRVLAAASAAVPSQDLIVIGREDGALLAFVADAAACFAAARAVREACLTEARYRDMQPRIGIDLGPVEVLEGEPGQALLGGEGRRDAERLMRQSPPCQISVSRSFFELLARVAPSSAAPLKYQGLLTDTVGRPLGWYLLDPALERRSLHGGEPDVEAPAQPGVAAARAGRVAGGQTGKLHLSLRYALLPLLALAAALSPLRELHAPAPAVPSADASAVSTLEAAPVPRFQPGPVTHAAMASPLNAPRARSAASARNPSAPSRRLTYAAPAARQPATAGAGAAAAATDLTSSRPTSVEDGPAASSSASVNVRLAVRPWGEVSVNGRKVGLTPPLKVLYLRPGKHVIAIANGTLPAYRRELVVRAGGAGLTLAHNFDCVPIRDLQCPEAIDTPLLASSRYRPKTTRDRDGDSGPVLISGRAGRPDLVGRTSNGPAGRASDAVAAR